MCTVACNIYALHNFLQYQKRLLNLYKESLNLNFLQKYQNGWMRLGIIEAAEIAGILLGIMQSFFPCLDYYATIFHVSTVHNQAYLCWSDKLLDHSQQSYRDQSYVFIPIALPISNNLTPQLTRFCICSDKQVLGAYSSCVGYFGSIMN